MASKSAVAALILILVLAVFSVLSFTIWRDVPHIIYMQSIITAVAGASLIILIFKHYEWRVTPNILNPIQIWKRVANWNMLDSTKMALATLGGHDKSLRLNIELVKKYPFNIDNCNPILVGAYHNGHKISEYVPQTSDEHNLAKVMKLAVEYDPYKVSHAIIEGVINDKCHNGVLNESGCWNIMKNLMKANALYHISDIYTLIDLITNYNPVADNKAIVKITDTESMLVDQLWNLTRDPNYRINFNVNDLSTIALFKFFNHLDLLDRALMNNNPKLLDNLKEAIKAVAGIWQLLKDKVSLYMIKNEFEPTYEMTRDGSKPPNTVYYKRRVLGAGKLTDPELPSIDVTTDINRIFYNNDNIHYDMNLIKAVENIEIDKHAIINNPHINPVLKSFIGLFKQKEN